MSVKEADMMKRVSAFRAVGFCDNCKHAIGYYKDYKELIHFLDLFPDDQLSEDIQKTHCKKPTFCGQTEEKMTQIAALFSEVKKLADERRKAFDEFKDTIEEHLDIELPYGFESHSDIDWQDVLVWGIEDASFEDFMRDLELERKEGFQ